MSLPLEDDGRHGVTRSPRYGYGPREMIVMVFWLSSGWSYRQAALMILADEDSADWPDDVLGGEDQVVPIVPDQGP